MKKPKVGQVRRLEMLTVRAIVTNVISERGYVVCQGPEGKSITFNLADWTEKTHPETGQTIILLNVVQYPKGLRAASAHLETYCEPAKQKKPEKKSRYSH